MYSFIRSYVVDNFNQWILKDISGESLKTIRGYSDLKIVLAVTANSDVELATTKQEVVQYISKANETITVSAWLNSFTEENLQTVDTPLQLSLAESVKMYPCWRIGAWTTNARVRGDDLRIQSKSPREEVDSEEYIRDNCVLVVNNLITRIQPYADAIYSYHAAPYLGASDNHSLSFIDFYGVGGLKTEAFTEDSVTVAELSEWEEANNELKVVFTSTERYTGGTPFMVLGGKIFIMDGRVKQLSPDRFTVLFREDQIIEQILRIKGDNEALDYIYNAEITKTGVRKDTLNIKKFFADHTCFFGYIGKGNLKTIAEPIPRSSMPMYYTHYRIPAGMMFFEDGTIAQSLLIDYNQHRACISVPFAKRYTFLQDTVTWNETKAKGTAKKDLVIEQYPLLFSRDIYWF